MKPDPDYLKMLLTAFQDAPGPTTDIQELEQAGFHYREPRFEFHLRILTDAGYVEAESKRQGIGLAKGADGAGMWSVIPLRLTASGHEFAEALSNSKAFETVKKNFAGASISTIREVAVGIIKAEIGRHTGLHL